MIPQELEVSPGRPRPATLFLLSTLFCLLLLVVDAVGLYFLISQWATLGYRETVGTVLRSEVIQRTFESGKRRPQHDFRVRYAYEVDGKSYESDEVVRSRVPTKYIVADELQQRFAQGTTVPVYYAPEAPSRPVLIQGPQATELLTLMALTPLNILAVLGQLGVARMARRREDGVGAIVREGRIRVPLVLGVGVWIPFLILCFGGAGFLADSRVYVLPLSLFLAVSGAVLAGGLLTLGWHLRRLRSGALELRLDVSRELLSLPALHGRKQPRDIPLRQIRTAFVDVRSSGSTPQPGFWPSLALRQEGGEEEIVPIFWVANKERADALAAWLSAQLRSKRRPSA